MPFFTWNWGVDRDAPAELFRVVSRTRCHLLPVVTCLPRGMCWFQKKRAIEQLRNPCWLMIGSALGNLVFGMIKIFHLPTDKVRLKNIRDVLVVGCEWCFSINYIDYPQIQGLLMVYRHFLTSNCNFSVYVYICIYISLSFYTYNTWCNI